MKTKIIISVIICTLFPFSKSMAQTYYYNTTKTFYENGYIYQCDVPEHNLLTLYNASNIYTYQDMYYSNGNVYRYNGRNNTVEDDTWTKPKCFSIVNNAFTPAEKARVLGEKIIITLIMDSQTGKIIEVNFQFLKHDPFATIPVSVYRQMELKFKSDIWFMPTAEGKKLNYIMHTWVHKIE